MRMLILNAYRKFFGKGRGLGDVFLLRSIIRFMKDNIRRYLMDGAVEVHEHRMYLDSRDSLNLLKRGTAEDYQTELMKEYIHTGATVLDIGANIGYYTLLFARWVGPEGTVHAFEPAPENYAILTKNIAMNGYANVATHQLAVSDRTADGALYLSDENKGDHRIWDSGEQRENVAIRMVKLDEIFQDLGTRVDLVKLDIQGAEFAAVSGMTELLRLNPQAVLFTEFDPSFLTAFGVDPLLYVELLHSFGFDIFQIHEGRRVLIPASKEYLCDPSNLDLGSHHRFTNLLCLPGKS
jgi:FkbM family methyltransferase